jgi:SAM-dependent methyltransferase
MSESNSLPSMERFSARAADYVRSRPGYPAEIRSVLESTGLPATDARIADIGSGTGLLSRMFLDAGYRVCGVEPNAAMREAAEKFLRGYASFESIDGRADATGLEPNSMDAIVAGQAFHWFDPEPTRAEWLRISRPEAVWAVIWNLRQRTATPFLRGYDALLERWGNDYASVSTSWEDTASLAVVFGRDDVRRTSIEMEQPLDFEGLKGLLLSFSYIPGPDSDARAPMLEDLAALFQEHVRDGRVAMTYDTVIYCGRAAD